MSRDVPVLDLDVPLLEELRAEGELLGRGAFDLDSERAREKLQSFQLVDPRHYVLEVIASAALLGARRVDASVSHSRVEIAYDGDVLSAEDLDVVHSAAFDRSLDPKRRALRHLALALNAVEGITPSHVLVESGYESFARLTVRPGKPDLLEKPAQLEHPGTRVFARERFRVGHLVDPLFKQHAPEVEIIREKAGFSRMSVWVNGTCVSAGMRLPQSSYNLLTFVRTPAEYGKIGIVYSTSAREHRAGLTRARILQHGIFITEHTVSWPYGHIDVIIDSRRLTKNLSQSAFVEDAAWHQLHDDVIEEAVCWLLHDRVRMTYETPASPPSPSTSRRVLEWIDRVCRGAIERAAQRRRDGKPLGEHMRALLEYAEYRPVIEKGGKKLVYDTLSLANLRVGLSHTRAVRFTAYDEPERPDMLIEDSPDLTLVEDYLGRDAVDSVNLEPRMSRLPWGRTDGGEAEVVAPNAEVSIGIPPAGQDAEHNELEMPELQLGAFYLGERDDSFEHTEHERIEDVEEEAPVVFADVSPALGERRDTLEACLLRLIEPSTRVAMAWKPPSGVIVEESERLVRIRFGQLVISSGLPELASALGRALEPDDDLARLCYEPCALERVIPLARRAVNELVESSKLERERREAAHGALVDVVWSILVDAPDPGAARLAVEPATHTQEVDS